ncbi:hypothetical protein HanXRQr2_Chr17g0778911 [Helianthus annuus]|uniref:Uncharacterized protein n=1 Tax=Helianthus annuus TaxID=4232 RepID=A0A9K3DDY9_HELAN|nr:hypothetical protein HanXRQr2_Chr17g0778911 [Helianthus annuus]KAJ0811133.1 hypothetical protein HanPSC8_Chr17g0747331 [Helianthus annuus]
MFLQDRWIQHSHQLKKQVRLRIKQIRKSVSHHLQYHINPQGQTFPLVKTSMKRINY